MAIQRNNILLHGTSGSFNKQITFKYYSGKTVVTKYPDMSKVISSKAQLAERIRFKLAVAYARTVVADPVKKRSYSKKKHFSAYHAAISEYMYTSKAAEKPQSNCINKEKPENTSSIIKPYIAPALSIVNRADSFQTIEQAPS